MLSFAFICSFMSINVCYVTIGRYEPESLLNKRQCRVDLRPTKIALKTYFWQEYEVFFSSLEYPKQKGINLLHGVWDSWRKFTRFGKVELFIDLMTLERYRRLRIITPAWVYSCVSGLFGKFWCTDKASRIARIKNQENMGIILSTGKCRHTLV